MVRRPPCLASIALLLVLTSCAGSSDGSTATTRATAAPVRTTQAPTTTAPVSPDAGSSEWGSYGHDLANTRLNPNETTIVRSTVAKLTESWSKADLVGVTGTPVVAGGVAYFGDWKGTVWALDAETGTPMWSTPVGGWIVGAPGLDAERVYVSSGHTLFALARATGKLLWQAETNEHPLAQINASPVVVDGLVFQGVASAEVVMAKDEYTFRGSISAFDATTGKQRWRLYTTNDDADGGAGVGIWSTPAVDVGRKTLYVGTGQNYSEPTGKLADSIVAVDYRTGKVQWSTQFTYPDVWSGGNPKGKDADVGSSPNLFAVDGHDLVGAGDKAGRYFALDRDTGKQVWEATLTPGSVFGGAIGSAASVDGKLIAVSNVGDPATNSPTNVARVFALDPATGRILWHSQDYPGKIFAPVSAVPGLAFVGTDAGTMVALDTSTGKQVWTHQAPALVACGPSIVDGRVLWGYGFILFAGPGDGGVISFTLEG